MYSDWQLPIRELRVTLSQHPEILLTGMLNPEISIVSVAPSPAELQIGVSILIEGGGCISTGFCKAVLVGILAVNIEW